MSSAKVIQSKIKSVNNVKKITRAMELVSISKMKRAVDAAQATREYAARALQLLVNLSKNKYLKHPLLKHGKKDKNLFIILSSNKGLAGSFNVNIAKAASSFAGRVRAKREAHIDAVTIGKRAEKTANRLGFTIVGSFVDFKESIQVDDVFALSKLVLDEFNTGEYYNVVVIYANFISVLQNEVVVRQILPVKTENIFNMIKDAGDREGSKEASVEAMDQYVFEPSEEEILNHVLIRLTESQLYQALQESSASEHSSRMVAMKNATENAKRLVDSLTLSYNQARQAGITREIAEIASGAEALSQ
jgi:F-type H+-transporting ATPase subunit gamma